MSQGQPEIALNRVIIGLDPGLCRTGWGVIEGQGRRWQCRAWGVIRPCTQASTSQRLVQLYTKLKEVISHHQPHEAVVERVFVGPHRSTLQLGLARGVVLLIPELCGAKVYEVAATSLKKTITGWGGAPKDQVAAMVKAYFPSLEKVPQDASDALALALHCAFGQAKKLLG